MDEDEVVKRYLAGETMRSIACGLGTNHKRISRILKRNGVEVRKAKNIRGYRKFPCAKELLCNNMLTHLRFNVTMEWLLQFDDMEKLKTLNKCITNREGRFDEDDEWYIHYIEKFYFDPQFNLVYSRWIASGKQRYLKPSVDHIHPRSLQGGNDLDNLQFLSWFENRCKNDMSQEEWDAIKQNMQEYLV